MSFFNELSRRNVIKVGITYIILSWLALQVTDVVLGNIDAPGWVFYVVLLLLFIGLIFALVFSWVFELTPEGLKREHEVDRSQSITRDTGRKIDRAIIALLAMGIVFMALDNYVFEDNPTLATSIEGELSEVPEAADDYDSIAVLPFANMSNDPDQDYFSDGISEELLNALAKLGDLQVAARTSSFAFKGQNQDVTEIGRKLNVDTLLEGSVRRAGTRLRVTAQLIDVSNGYHLWSESYDRELTDVFALQDEITNAIVDALRIHLDTGDDLLPVAPGPTSVSAYDAYLKGRHALQGFGTDAMRDALTFFRAATEADPGFAPAWAGRAIAVIALRETDFWGAIPAEDAHLLARNNIDRALALDPDLPDAYWAEALLFSDTYRYEDALRSLDRAIELNPNLAEAWSTRSRILGRFGRVREAREAMLVALELDPHNPITGVIAANLANDFYDPEFVEVVEKTSSQYPRVRQLLALTKLAGNGRMTKEEYARILESVGGDGIFVAVTNFQVLKEIDEELLAEVSRNSGDYLMWAYMGIDQWDKATAMYDALPPERQQSDLNLEELSVMRASMGLFEDALESLDAAHDGQIRIHGVVAPNSGRSNSNLALNRVFCLRQLARDAEAGPVLDAVRTFVETLRANTVYGNYMVDAKLRVLDGDIEGALSVLETAYERNELDWTRRYDPILRSLAGEPRFDNLFEQIDRDIDALRSSMGLPPAEI